MFTAHDSFPPSDDEVAAALAAVQLMLDGEAEPEVVPQRGAWQAAAALESRGLMASRMADYAAWPAAERAVRARRWSRGIVGS